MLNVLKTNNVSKIINDTIVDKFFSEIKMNLECSQNNKRAIFIAICNNISIKKSHLDIIVNSTNIKKTIQDNHLFVPSQQIFYFQKFLKENENWKYKSFYITKVFNKRAIDKTLFVIRTEDNNDYFELRKLIKKLIKTFGTEIPNLNLSDYTSEQHWEFNQFIVDKLWSPQLNISNTNIVMDVPTKKLESKQEIVIEQNVENIDGLDILTRMIENES